MVRLTISVLSLLIAFASDARADRASEDAWLAEIREIWAHAHENTAWQRIEQKALTMAQGRAARRGPNLILRLSNGQERIYRNQEKCDDGPQECDLFRLQAHLPSRQLFVIDEGFYEGGQNRIVDDRTGRETVLDAEPRFGPDPAVILVIDDDEAYGSGRELQIWRRKGDGWVREWMREAGDEPNPHRIEILRWEKPGEILLEMRKEEWLNHPQQRWPAVIKRGRNGWRLEMTPPSAN